MLGGQRGEHRGREERTREEAAAHLLHEHDDVDQAQTEPAGVLRHERPGPPEVDDLLPHVVGHAAIVVEHGPHVAVRGLTVEEGPDRASRS